MFGWSVLAPAFLLGGLAVAVPILLHLMRRERLPRVPFSDIRFLRQRAPEPRRRRRLHELLLLALRVAALLLLALAFARPYLADANERRPLTVVLVDMSFSVSSPAQVAEVRRLAAGAIDAAPAGHQVAVVAFDTEARVVADVDSARSVARAAAGRLEPRPRATRYQAGLSAVAELAAGRTGRLVLVTDRQLTGWTVGRPAPATGLTLEVLEVPPPPSNTAVATVGGGPDGVVTTLTHVGEPVEARVSLELDGETVADLEVAIESGATTVRFPMAAPDDGVAIVRVSDEQGFAADNARHHLFEPPPRSLVTLVATEADDGAVLFLEQALSPRGEEGPFTVEVRAASALADDGAVDLASGVAILTGTSRLTRRGRERLAAVVRSGGGLLLAAGPDVDQTLVNALFEGEADLGLGEVESLDSRRSLVLAARRHSSLVPLGDLASSLDRVRFDRRRAIGAGDLVVARFDDGAPALVEHRIGEGRVLVWASDLAGAWNDLPRQPVFAPWLTETVASLSSATSPARAFVVSEAPPGVPDRPGIAALASEGGGQRTIVVNAAPAESALERLAPTEFDHRVDAGLDGAVAAVSDEGPDDWVWRYLLAAMLVVLLAEGLVAGRVG